jgi:hypothetical protein
VIKTKSGIADALVYYTADTTLGFSSVQMHFTNGDTAVGYIPQQLDGTEIFYYVSATSNNGKKVSKPLVAPSGFYSFLVENSITNIAQEVRTEQYHLSQNYPNPFNPSTKIKFSIPVSPLNPSTLIDLPSASPRGEHAGYKNEGNEERFVTLKVYDVLGNEVATLVNNELPAGEYEVDFKGDGLTSGIYFYQLKTQGFVESQKMVLMK